MDGLAARPPADQAALARASLCLDDRHLGLWREEVCDRLLDADAPWTADRRLDLALDLVARGGLVSLAVSSPTGGPELARGARRVANPGGPPMLGLTVVTAGRGEVELDGHTIELAAGDLFLLSSQDRFRKRMGAGYAEAFLYCPLALAEAALGRRAPALASGLAPRTAEAHILTDTLTSLRRHAAALSTGAWTPLVGAVVELAATVFAPVPAPATSAAELAWRARVERYLDDHLAEPALAPPTIAAALGISLRYLHKLFEPTGSSVAAMLHARRLDRAHALVLDRAWRRRSIAEVARAVGFRRADHFSRAFRARFGVTARELRAAGAAGGRAASPAC